VFAAHGHQFGVDNGTDMISRAAALVDADIIFFGHTHRMLRDETGAALILNPGSCVRPRGSSTPSFAIVSFPGATERFDVRFYEIKRTLFGGVEFLPFSG